MNFQPEETDTSGDDSNGLYRQLEDNLTQEWKVDTTEDTAGVSMYRYPLYQLSTAEAAGSPRLLV